MIQEIQRRVGYLLAQVRLPWGWPDRPERCLLPMAGKFVGWWKNLAGKPAHSD
jgi:hypothetical protein